MENRFLVFIGDTYYPSGGWGDFHRGFSSIEECLEYIKAIKCDWWQIVDAQTLKIVKEW